MQAAKPFLLILFGVLLSLIIIEMPRAMAFIPGFIALAVLALYSIKDKNPPDIPTRSIATIGAVFALAGLSYFWSYDTANTVQRSFKIAPLFIVGALCVTWGQNFKTAHIRPYFTLLSAALIAGALLVVAELHFLSPLYKIIRGLEDSQFVQDAVYNRGTNILVISCFCTMSYWLHSAKKPLYALLLMASIFTLMTYTDSQSAQLAFVAGLIFFFAFPYRFKAAWYGLIGLITLGLCGAPFIAPWLYSHADYINTLPFLGGNMGYAGPRLEIWDYVSRYALQSPILGYGVDSTRVITDFDSAQTYIAGNTIFHPHNFALQIWIEFGALGALCGSILIGWIIYSIKNVENITAQRACLASLIAALSIFTTGYGMWQSWWLGAIFFTLAHCLFICRLHKETPQT